nr:hypothetical protein [Treponema endosymbiont of Eucomonympha sp.]
MVWIDPYYQNFARGNIYGENTVIIRSQYVVLRQWTNQSFVPKAYSYIYASLTGLAVNPFTNLMPFNGNVINSLAGKIRKRP